jgi:TATA-box binding protein (TBP) (component of TFIID and TFIIIB)
MSDIKVYCTPYRVSTITCNADIGKNININLFILFENILINNNEKSFIWMQYLKEDVDLFKGVYPKKKRKSKKDTTKKNRFDNQVTVIFKITETYMPNIKIFKNGNIQLTGIKNCDDTVLIINAIIEEIKRIYEINKDILIESDINNLQFLNFKIRMINTDFKTYIDEGLTKNYHIRRKELHKLLISDLYNNKCSFQPGIYQGVKLEFFWNSINKINDGKCNCEPHCFGKSSGNGLGNCKKVTIAIFESGSILITGGISFEQIDSAYRYICNIIIKHENIIRRPDISCL